MLEVDQEIFVSLQGCGERKYIVHDIQGKAISLKPHEDYPLPNVNSSAFWLPKSALIECNDREGLKNFSIAKWFEYRASRAQLISLGKQI